MTTTPAEIPGTCWRTCRIARALNWLAELASRLVEPTECGWMIHCGGNGLIFVADTAVQTRKCGCGGTWAVEETSDDFAVGTCWACRRLVIGPAVQLRPTDSASTASADSDARPLSTTLGDAE